MNNISIMTSSEIEEYALLYISAYSAEPWKEEYKTSQIIDYIQRFINFNERYGIIYKIDNKIIGLVLGMKIPAPDGDYFRIEDMCINSSEQRKGYGSEFFNQLKYYIKQNGMDSIVLGTVKGYPSFEFYIKNGFRHVESSALMFCEL